MIETGQIPTSFEFVLPEARGTILLSGQVLQHIYQHAQRRLWQREAGGLLFSPSPELSQVEITHATGPNRRDIRSRYAFIPHVPTAIADCRKHFECGRYAVGLWHTHPEAYPVPSILDRKTTQEYLSAYNGQLDCFLLLILGNQGQPPKLAAWLALGESMNDWYELEIR